MKIFTRRGLFAKVATLIRNRPSAKPRHKRPFTARPCLEALEDRTLLSAGMLDPTFGIGGKVTTDNPAVVFYNIPVAAASDGKILVAGTGFVVLRYTADGSLDPTFGVGGKVTTDFGGLDDGQKSLMVTSDGKIVVAGTVEYIDMQNNVHSDFAVAHYNPDGSLVASFGNGGKRTIGGGDFVAGSKVFISSAALQGDGSMVVVGNQQTNFVNHVFVGRLTPTGVLDPSFGNGGTQMIDFGSSGEMASAVALQSDGSIVVVGRTNFPSSSPFAVARLTSAGQLDATFGDGGKKTIDFGQSTGASGVALQPDGKIVVVGDTAANSTDLDFAVARLNSAGELDNTFGTSGKQTGDFGEVAFRPTGVALQSDDSIVLVTTLGNPGHFAVAQLTSAGVPDFSFGTGGYVVTEFRYNDRASGVMVQAHGDVVVAGLTTQYAGVGGFNALALARYQGSQRSTTATALTSSAISSEIGQPVTFTATVSGGTTTATGTVKFFDGDTLLDTETLANGTGQFTTSALPAGSRAITVLYSGDPGQGYFSSTGSLTQTINKHATGAALTSSANPSVYAQAVTLMDTVSAVAGTPTGSITFVEGSTLLGTGTLVSGTAKFTTSALVGGDHSITAFYSGDANFASASAALTQTVNKAVQTITFGPMADGSYNGDPFILSVTASSGLPVSLAVLSGPATLSGTTLTITGAGTVVIEASQAGSGNFNAAVVNHSFTVNQLTRTGKLDPTFGNGGKQIIDFTDFVNSLIALDPSLPYFTPPNARATGVAVQPDGSILVVGTFDDTQYGITTDLTPGGGVLDEALGLSFATPTAVQADGKTLVVGTSYQGVTGNDFLVQRYNTDGSLDTSFGNAGTVTIDFGSYQDVATGVAVQPDGKIVVVGYSYQDSAHGYVFAVARLEGYDPAVVGTAGDDSITIAAGTQAGTLKVTVNGLVTDNRAASGLMLVEGLGGNDTFTVSAALAGGLILAGQGGSDTYTVNLGNLAGPVTVAGSSGTDTLTVNGTPGDDVIVVKHGMVTWGNPVAETIAYSGIASATVDGGAGNDTITDPDSSNVTLLGGPGNDTIIVANTTGPVTADGGPGANTYLITMGALDAPVTINGTAGTSSLTVIAPPGTNTLTLSATQLTGAGETINLNLGTTATKFTVDGSAGNNQLVPPPAPVTPVNITVPFGKITGGGDIGTGSAFGFVVQANQNGSIKGNLDYQDKANHMRLKSTAITLVSILQDNLHALFTGTATVNGVSGYSFTVTVEDHGEPGTGRDRFRIQFSGPTSYDSNTLAANGGLLTAGNIEIHKGGSSLVADGSSPASSSTDNTGALINAAGQVLVGVFSVSVQDDNGSSIDPCALARIQDSLTYLDNTFGFLGLNLTLADPASTTPADIRIHLSSSSPLGGVAEGVLGYTTATGEITLVSGWNWYTGTDTSLVGTDQFDFQTVTTHELGHSLGLGHSPDAGSVMYLELASGAARHTFTTSDLANLHDNDGDGGVGALHAAIPQRSGQRELPARSAPTTPATPAPAPAAVRLPGLLDLGAHQAPDVPLGLFPTAGPTSAPVWLLAPTDSNPAYVAGGGGDILLGGDGSDIVLGEPSRELLVGGFGTDSQDTRTDDELKGGEGRFTDAEARAWVFANFEELMTD